MIPFHCSEMISYHFTKKGEIIRTRLEGRNAFRHIALKWQHFLQFCKRSQYLSRHKLVLDFFVSVEFVKFIVSSGQIRQSFFERFFHLQVERFHSKFFMKYCKGI